MKVSLELWNNQVYKRESNKCFLTPHREGTYFYKMAFRENRLYSDSQMGFQGEIWLSLACPLEAAPNLI